MEKLYRDFPICVVLQGSAEKKANFESPYTVKFFQQPTDLLKNQHNPSIAEKCVITAF